MYIFGVKSVMDGVSKFYVQSEHSAEIGDIVSFDTNDYEQFAVIEVIHFSYKTNIEEILAYLGEAIHPINCLFSAGYKRAGNAGTP